MINNKSVSLAMVVYNSSDEVEKLIDHLVKQQIIDEVVIVDQGSDDIHSEKLELLADQYIKTTNKGNADYDRQFCYSLCTKDYILALDADEWIDEDNCIKLRKIMQEYEFDCVWLLFKNLISFDDKEIDIKEFLGDDPHPRFWRKITTINNQNIPTLIWPNEAHTFPQINTNKVIFGELFVLHSRKLENVVRTHIRRGKNIDEKNQMIEKGFIHAVIEKFGNDVKLKLQHSIPELTNYLKN
jgi:glycosyltransferase involved in cell wall biosynthesis